LTSVATGRAERFDGAAIERCDGVLFPATQRPADADTCHVETSGRRTRAFGHRAARDSTARLSQWRRFGTSTKGSRHECEHSIQNAARQFGKRTAHEGKVKTKSEAKDCP
jgi:hypothetical protein